MSRPEPPVPPECTMSGNDWFPLHFDRLRKSKWWRRATDLARARNVMLWGEAYKQVPAGSMPDDDDDLAEAAGFGMDVEAFLAAKADVMAPWVLCSDGRWYHPTVCEVVLEAWEKASERKKSAAAKKAAQRAKSRGHGAPPSPVPEISANVSGESGDVPGDTEEKRGDFRTQDITGEDSTEPPLVPRGDEQLFGLETDEPKPPDPVQMAFDLWNETAELCGLPKAKMFGEAVRRAIRKRLEAGGIETWREAMEAVKVSAFLRGLRPGSDGRTFRADLTFVCQAKSYQRLVDGGYGQDAEPPRPRGAPAPAVDPWVRRVQEFTANGYWNRLDWGPAPGKPGCQVSAEIQRAAGVDPAKPEPLRGAA